MAPPQPGSRGMYSIDVQILGRTVFRQIPLYHQYAVVRRSVIGVGLEAELL